jgi:hypothetical protein
MSNVLTWVLGIGLAINGVVMLAWVETGQSQVDYM